MPSSSAPTASRPMAMWPTRWGPISRRWPAPTTGFPSTSPHRARPSISPSRTAVPSRSRPVTATNSATCTVSTRAALRPACANCPPPRPSPTRPSTSHRRAWSAASSPNVASVPPARMACSVSTRRPAVTDLRDTLIATARTMQTAGLNKGTSGNVSVRQEQDFLITPTGLPYADLVADDIPLMALDGSHTGRCKPSSEWRFHRDLYATRPEVGAVLHAHSPFAVSLACLRRDIPPFHYMIARFGGDTLRCADYAIFGSAELSAAALAAMQDRKACLLANHGMLVAARDLTEALALAIELEELCEQYWRACQLGEPVLLSSEEMAAVQEKFKGYGQQ